jgi:hypothetical protein
MLSSLCSQVWNVQGTLAGKADVTGLFKLFNELLALTQGFFSVVKAPMEVFSDKSLTQNLSPKLFQSQRVQYILALQIQECEDVECEYCVTLDGCTVSSLRKAHIYLDKSARVVFVSPAITDAEKLAFCKSLLMNAIRTEIALLYKNQCLDMLESYENYIGIFVKSGLSAQNFNAAHLHPLGDCEVWSLKAVAQTAAVRAVDEGMVESEKELARKKQLEEGLLLREERMRDAAKKSYQRPTEGHKTKQANGGESKQDTLHHDLDVAKLAAELIRAAAVSATVHHRVGVIVDGSSHTEEITAPLPELQIVVPEVDSSQSSSSSATNIAVSRNRIGPNPHNREAAAIIIEDPNREPDTLPSGQSTDDPYDTTLSVQSPPTPFLGSNIDIGDTDKARRICGGVNSTPSAVCQHSHPKNRAFANETLALTKVSTTVEDWNTVMRGLGASLSAETHVDVTHNLASGRIGEYLCFVWLKKFVAANVVWINEEHELQLPYDIEIRENANNRLVARIEVKTRHEAPGQTVSQWFISLTELLEAVHCAENGVVYACLLVALQGGANAASIVPVGLSDEGLVTVLTKYTNVNLLLQINNEMVR